MQALLNDVVLDHKNPHKLYKLAREYDRLEQGAGAFTFYMRAAEFNDAEDFADRWVQYKSVIFMALIHHREGNRDVTARGLFQLALTVMPERPEGYYIFARWLADRHEWRDALMYSRMGLQCDKDLDSPDDELPYVGWQGLQYIYAVAKWKTDGKDTSKNLLFEFKHKTKVDQYHLDEIEKWIKNTGYPSTLPYVREEMEDYKFPFPGIETIKKNYSRHFQDMWVLSILDGRKKGHFVEIGSGDPWTFNNTALLETEFDWTGINIECDDKFCYKHSRERKSTIIHADAAQIDYEMLFKSHCIEQISEFLRINSEGVSLEVLRKIPLDKYEFLTIQFQHNACWWGNEFREESRKLLSERGYKLWANDVSASPKENYEDWWIHPALINKREMKSDQTKINFAWEYMMKENRK